jgi:ABC-type polysaccharide/polyol phosphate export permease
MITFGLSTIAAHIGVFLDDVNDLLPIIMRLWMYFTGIFYSIQDKVPGTMGFWLLRLNPLAFLLDGLRQALLFHKTVMWAWYFGWLGISWILCLEGLKLLYHYGARYLKVV